MPEEMGEVLLLWVSLTTDIAGGRVIAPSTDRSYISLRGKKLRW